MAKKNQNPTEGKPSDAANDQASAAKYASRIEAVKELIFGEDNAEIREQLDVLNEKIEAEISGLNERLSGVIDELDKSTQARIDNMEMDLKSEIDRLDYNKSDRFQLGKMLEDIGKTLQEK